MGKFDGMLLLSDYDNTLVYTEEALRSGGPRPPMSRRNLSAIRRWMAEGGRFSVATGRALEAFRRHAHEVPVNAPVIVDNGGAIYDLERGTYVVKNFLPAEAAVHIAAVAERFPHVALELYPDRDVVLVLRPPGQGVLFAGLVTIGLGCAPIYPSIIHETPANFGREVSLAMTGIQMAFAYVGSCLMPPLFGLLAQYVTPALYPWFLAALLALMFAMAESLHRRTREKRRAVETGR